MEGLDVSLLSEALRNIASQKGHGIETLRLESVVRVGDVAAREPGSALPLKHRAMGFQSAAKTFAVVASSMRDNGPTFQRLELFSGDPAPSWNHVPYDTFGRFAWEVSKSWPTLSTVKKLSLRMSDRFTEITDFESTKSEGPVNDHGLESESSATMEEVRIQVVERERKIYARHCENIVRMQQLCRRLEELDVSWHRLSYVKSFSPHDKYNANCATAAIAQWNARQSYMHHLSQSEPLPHLRKLQLGGLNLPSEDLLASVQKHKASLREISLDNIQALNSSFGPLFEFLTSQQCAVERIHLDDLEENCHWLKYLRERESQFTKLSGDQLRCNVIDQWGADVKLRIQYHSPTKRWRVVGSGAACRAHRRKIVNFGSYHAGVPWWKVDMFVFAGRAFLAA